jgi:hypothetical protein
MDETMAALAWGRWSSRTIKENSRRVDPSGEDRNYKERLDDGQQFAIWGKEFVDWMEYGKLQGRCQRHGRRWTSSRQNT